MNTPEPDYLARRLDAQYDCTRKRRVLTNSGISALEITTMGAGACIPIVNVLRQMTGRSGSGVASAVLAALVVLDHGM